MDYESVPSLYFLILVGLIKYLEKMSVLNNNNVTSGKSQEKRVQMEWNEMVSMVIWIFHSLKNVELNVRFFSSFFSSKFKNQNENGKKCQRPLSIHPPSFQRLIDRKGDKKNMSFYPAINNKS